MRVRRARATGNNPPARRPDIGVNPRIYPAPLPDLLRFGHRSDLSVTSQRTRHGVRQVRPNKNGTRDIAHYPEPEFGA